MTTTIPVGGEGFAAYEVVVGRGLLKQAGARVAALKPTRAFIVSDETVAAVHGETVRASLEAAGLKTGIVTVPAGEASKSFEQLEAVL
ncbi:MAG TPA: 3-dehydroquinate synthase, partial [Brevundimonas sp.]|nr:3-dehydroquinate synthase [Brevundimonas sp.]